MNWTRVHLRTFYSRVLRCKLNRTALLYKRTLPLFLYMRQIKTSDELDKSVCAGGWATDLSCSNEQTAELNPSLSNRPTDRAFKSASLLPSTNSSHRSVMILRRLPSNNNVQKRRGLKLKNVWWRFSVHIMLSSDDSKLTLLWSPPEEATRITFLHYIPTSHNSDASLNSLPIWNLSLPILSAPSTLSRFVTSHSPLFRFEACLSLCSCPACNLSLNSTCLLLVCNLASLQTPHVMTNPSSKNKRVIATCPKKNHPWMYNIIYTFQILSMSWSVMIDSHLE